MYALESDAADVAVCYEGLVMFSFIMSSNETSFAEPHRFQFSGYVALHNEFKYRDLMGLD